jgi:hypothetical protein
VKLFPHSSILSLGINYTQKQLYLWHKYANLNPEHNKVIVFKNKARYEDEFNL